MIVSVLKPDELIVVTFKATPTFVADLDNYVATEGFRHASDGKPPTRSKVIREVVQSHLNMMGYKNE